MRYTNKHTPYTVWKMKVGSPTPIHVDTLDKAVTEALRS
jgi:hypothetical protein